MDHADKLKQAKQTNVGRQTKAAQVTKISKVTKDWFVLYLLNDFTVLLIYVSTKTTTEQLHGLMSQVFKDHLFNKIQPVDKSSQMEVESD